MELEELRKLIENGIESRITLNKSYMNAGKYTVYAIPTGEEIWNTLNVDEYYSIEVVECYRSNGQSQNKSYYVQVSYTERSRNHNFPCYSSRRIYYTKIYNRFSEKKINRLLDEVVQKYKEYAN